MKQRIICIVLALFLILGVLAPLAMAASPSEDEAATVLAALDIMVGDEDGNLNLSNTITRAEFTKMSVAATSYKDTVGDTASVSPFPDVPKTNWAAPWISVAVDNGMVQGDLYGNFNPNSTITLAEGVTIVLRLLGYQDSSFSGTWPSGQMTLYTALDLDEGISLGQDDPMTREDAMYLFYNLMTTPTATGSGYYLNSINYGMVSSDGEIDMVALVNDAMKGPMLADTGWEDSININPSIATVYRDGSPSNYTSICPLDVIYWSESMQSLWVYSQKVTGTYQAASPSASAPTAIVVAGQTYTIEATSAAYDLSDLGTYNVGDQITIFIGRNGGIVAVADAATASSILYGMVTITSTDTYQDSNGNSYVSDTVTVMSTNGVQYTYPVDDDDWDVGDMVQLTFGTSGTTIKTLSSKTISGKVNSTATKLGSYTFADDVEIIDVYTDGGSGVRIYPSRLTGITISSSDVAFYATNQDGEITHLILKDVTGDMHSYGVLTTVSEVSYNMSLTGTYVADIGGVTAYFSSSNKLFGVSKGPAVIQSSGGSVLYMKNLTEVEFDTVTATQGVTEDYDTYAIWESVTVYERKNGTYYLTSLDRVNDGSYTLTGYYDTAESDGGLVRVIVAK